MFSNLIRRLILSIQKINWENSKFGNKPFIEQENFPWTYEVENYHKEIKEELIEILKNNKNIPRYEDVIGGEENNIPDDNWKTFFLWAYGYDVSPNSVQAPKTMEALKKIPNLKTAFFSVLESGGDISPHTDYYNGVLRYHLGVIVDDPELCAIKVGNEERKWNEGESLILDGSFPHYAWNDSDKDRIILIVDFEKPIKFPFSILNKIALFLFRWSPYVAKSKEKFLKFTKSQEQNIN